MHLPSLSPLALLSSFLLLPLPLASALSPVPETHTATLHYLPSSTPRNPKPLAVITYSPHNPHLSRITNFTPPPPPSSKNIKGEEYALVQVGICYAGREGCRTSAALLSSFHPPYAGRLRVTVTPEGKVLGVNWRAWTLSSPSSSTASSSGSNPKAGQEGRYREGGRGDFDIVLPASAPGVYVEKPATKGKGGAGAKRTAGGEGEKKDGEEEEAVEEKSFLQKYWWVILAVTIFAMAGGGPDK